MRLRGCVRDAHVSGTCLWYFVAILNKVHRTCFQSTSSLGSQFIFFHYNETQEPDNDTTATPTRRIQGAHYIAIFISYIYSYIF